jgi:hypothetical protein
MRRTTILLSSGVLALSGAAPTLAQTPRLAPTPHDRAVTEARTLVGLAPVLSGATEVDHAPVKRLARAPQGWTFSQTAVRERWWTINESSSKAYQALTGTTPAGLRHSGSGSSTGPHESLRYVVDSPKSMPPGIAFAELDVAVTPTGAHTSAIGVYGQAVPEPKRSAGEVLPPNVHRVHVAIHVQRVHGKPVWRRGNTVTGEAAKQIAADFNALMVQPLGGVYSCPAEIYPLHFQVVTFHVNGRRLTATPGACGFVEVKSGGHYLRALDPDRAFDRDINNDLAAHIPHSVHQVRIVQRKQLKGKVTRHRTVTGHKAKAVVREFDHLHKVPRGTVNCLAIGGPQTTVTFLGKVHTWQTNQSSCTNVQVTEDGTHKPTLLASRAWNRTIGRDLRR